MPEHFAKCRTLSGFYFPQGQPPLGWRRGRSRYLDCLLYPGTEGRDFVQFKVPRIGFHVAGNLVVRYVFCRSRWIRKVLELVVSPTVSLKRTAIVDVGTLFDSDQYTGFGGENLICSCLLSSSRRVSARSAPRSPLGREGKKAPRDGGGVGTDSGVVISGDQFHIPPAEGCRSKTVTSRPLSRRCRAAGAPEAPDPTTATFRMGCSKRCGSGVSVVISGMRM